MFPVGFDTETYLITKANTTPKPVCCTWFDGNRRWITRPGDPETYSVLARPDTVLIGHGVVYDLLVMMRWHPETVPLLIQMLDEGRVRDTDIRESLWYLQTKGGFGFPDQWSLADLVMKYYQVDISQGKDAADAWRLRFGTLDGVPFDRWPSEARDYAMDDAVWAYKVAQAQGIWQETLPTEETQVRGAVALGGTSSWGFRVNQDVLQDIRGILTDKIRACDEITGHLGWTGKGSEARVQRALRQAWNYKQAQQLQSVAQMQGWNIDWSQWPSDEDIQAQVKNGNLHWFSGDVSSLQKVVLAKNFPKPPTTKKKLKSGHANIQSDEPAIRLIQDCYLVTDASGQQHEAFRIFQDRKHYNKLKGTYCEALMGAEVIHAGFRTLVSTGRTGCREPNLQNWPARDDLPMRRMFQARPGMKLGTVDWGAVELCTLAATIRTFWPHVRCHLGEVLDRGDDPHCLTASIFLKKPYEEVYAGRKGEFKDIRQGSKACYSGDTELMTPEGWVRIDQLGTQEVIQVCPHTKKASFVVPLAKQKYDGCRFLAFSNSQMDCKVTPNHRMLAISRSGYCMEILAEDYEDNEQFSSMHAAFLDYDSFLSPLETRLAVMIQADGSYQKGQVKLGFSKQRKIDRCRELLEEFGVPYRVSSYGKVTTFSFERRYTEDFLSPEKTFLSWRSYHPEAFVDEIKRWDGSINKKHTAQFFSSAESNVETAQIILVLNGYKAHRSEVLAPGKKTQHVLTYYIGDRKKNPQFNRLSGLHKEPVPGTDTSYCVTVPTGWLLTRRNGKVTVCGNSNFGFPGGLGLGAFMAFAENNYGVKLTYQEAAVYHRGWCKAYPEIPGTFLAYVKQCVPRGQTGTAILINGRQKADCILTQHANFHFQALAADGGKESHYNIWRECVIGGYYRRRPGLRGYGYELGEGYLAQSHPVNFVHDETVCEHPDGEAGKKALGRQEEIMIDCMGAACQHKVPITVEGCLSDEWAH